MGGGIVSFVGGGGGGGGDSSVVWGEGGRICPNFTTTCITSIF